MPLVDELLDSLRAGIHMQFAVISLPGLAATVDRLDLGDALRKALSGQPASVWHDVVRAYASGEFAAAADLLQRLGAKPDEAEARVRAGGQEQLQRALVFYRSVGATRYVSECEALLATG
jgi:hypothetical protein